jgi:hypothetical protein
MPALRVDSSVIDRAMMEASSSIAKLCKVCSRLELQRMIHPFHPCRNPMPCSTPPIERRYDTDLGSVNEIKNRRSTCDICRLIAESLDKEPSLNGTCSMKECEEFFNFKLPGNVKARDPSITHFHFTQASVMLDTSSENNFYGPALPWERGTRSSHYVLNFQVS